MRNGELIASKMKIMIIQTGSAAFEIALKHHALSTLSKPRKQ